MDIKLPSRFLIKNIENIDQLNLLMKIFNENIPEKWISPYSRLKENFVVKVIDNNLETYGVIGNFSHYVSIQTYTARQIINKIKGVKIDLKQLNR